LFGNITVKPSSFSLVGLALLLSSPTSAQERHCGAPPKVLAQARLAGANQDQVLGKWFEEAQQPRCAVQSYRHGLLSAPVSGPLHQSLGLALLESGERDEAAAELARALALDPSLPASHLALGVIEHDRGHTSEALSHWEAALLLDPGSVTALDWIAKTRIEAGQYTAAIDLLGTAPDAEDLQVDRIVAYSKAAFFEEAINVGLKAAQAHPDWLRVRMALATILVQRNRYQEAASILKTTLESNPRDFELQLLYLRVLVLADDLDAARPVASAFLKDNPTNFDALYLSGLLDRKNGDYALALDLLTAASKLQPDHFDVSYNLGTTLAKLHRPDQARLELEHAESLDSSGPDVHFQLAGVLRSLGDTAAAKAQMASYEEKLSSRAIHDQVISLSTQAAQRLAAGDAAGAAAIEKTILNLSPQDAVHYFDLSLALDQLGDVAAERAALEHAVALLANFATAYNQLGYLAIHRGDDLAAESFFRKAVACSPQYAEAESNLGSVLAKEGKDAEAEQHFRTAVAANPRYTDAWINLAASLAERSKFSDARTAATNALRIEPGNTDAARLLQMISSEKGPDAP
jgi:tetratricopeptide (TPR) repeat protein